jgi:hypothetical protein
MKNNRHGAEFFLFSVERFRTANLLPNDRIYLPLCVCVCVFPSFIFFEG